MLTYDQNNLVASLAFDQINRNRDAGISDLEHDRDDPRENSGNLFRLMWDAQGAAAKLARVKK